MIRNREILSSKMLVWLSCTALLLLFTPTTRAGAVKAVIISTILFFLCYSLIKKNIIYEIKKYTPSFFILPGMICLMPAVNFYQHWIKKMASLIGVPLKFFVITVTLFLSAASMLSIALFCKRFFFNFLGLSKNKLTSYKFMVKPALILTAIYSISYIAIIRSNFNYIDDMGRVAKGYSAWGYALSRHISDFLSTFIHADFYLTDVSPLPQIIATAVLGIASAIVLYTITGKTSFSFWEYIAVTPLGLSPYFLECISYKYDSPYMALSILFSVLPLLFLKGRSPYVFCFVTFISTLIVCTTYQSSTGIFPMLTLIICLQNWIENKNTLKQLLQTILSAAAGYCGGGVFFKCFIMKPYNDYVSNSLPPINQLVPTIINNYKKYFSYIVSDFKLIWIVFVVLLIALFVIKQVICSKQNKVLSFVLSAATVAAMIFLMFGVYPALSKPLFAPRAMYGAGLFIAFISVGLAVPTRGDNAVQLYAKPIILMLTWMFFTFSFTYGNALYVQKEYTDFRITEVITDINEIYLDNAQRNIQIEGSIGYSPIIKNMPQNYQILNRLIPITFKEKFRWGGQGIVGYYGLNLNLVLGGYSSDVLKDMKLPLLKDTLYHTIYGDDSNILVKLK